MSQILIRAYDKRYQDQVLELAREMHAESVTHCKFPLDEAKLLEQLQCCDTMPDSVYFRLAVQGETVVGGFYGIISGLFFSPDRAAKDMAWFVKRTKRGSVAAVLLVVDFEEWAKARGVTKFYLGQSTGVNIETTTALYQKLGYRVIGNNTFKEI